MDKLFANHLLRGAFYSLTIVLGLQVALIELDGGRFRNFIIFSFVLGFIFIVELLSGLVFRSAKIKSSLITQAEISAPKLVEEVAHHILIPYGLFISSAGFIFFNRQPGPRNLYLFLLFLALTVLFTNIRAFYEHRARIEHRTHYIYDTLKLVLFFTSTNVFFHLWSEPEQIYIPVVVSALLAMGLWALTALRYRKFELPLAIFLLAAAVVLASALIAIAALAYSNPLQLSAFAVLAYYLSAAILHHRMHRTLSSTILIEYTAVAAISLVILFGLAR